ncbi:MAG: thymidine phosphorylase, partial [Chloroflexi bacterium]
MALFVQGVVDGSIPDYQAAAWCMAVFFRGLDEVETLALTNAMVRTGKSLDLSNLRRPTVDKHSTGGVGDKTTLVVGPIMAALGAAMAKMSGRGLGHTGGTLDKLESIPGLRTELTLDRFMAQVDRIGLAVCSQTAELVPADKKFYALRDVTGTVPSIPLIAASIMAKKLAAGTSSIVLDVKYGNGAILPLLEDARNLADLMAKIGAANNRRIKTFLTSMEQPLGRAIGNALEVNEALNTLSGHGPPDLLELFLELAVVLLVLADLAPDRQAALIQARHAIEHGSALNKLREMIEAQGGDGAVVENRSLLPSAKLTTVVAARASGYLAGIDTAGLGRIALRLGAGRSHKDEPIDPGAGMVFLVRLGDRIDPGMPLAELYSNKLSEIEPAQESLRSCCRLSQEPPTPLDLIATYILGVIALRVYLSAGEYSGEMHAATLARALRAHDPDVELIGMGGSAMRAAGVEVLFDPIAASTIGFLEALASLRRYRQLLQEVTSVLAERRPDVVVWVDFGGFNLALAGECNRLGLPVVCVFSPS